MGRLNTYKAPKLISGAMIISWGEHAKTQKQRKTLMKNKYKLSISDISTFG
jgi:hypothetical protein